MGRLPKIKAHCAAGCAWETIHREEFLRSASLVEVYPNENVVWSLERNKQYKIFAPKDENCAFDFQLYVDYHFGKHYIATVTNDEYADWFVFRFLDYKLISGTTYKVVYEIEGNRYTEVIADGDADIAGIVLSGATQVFLYNDDATVMAKDGNDGNDGADGTYGTYYTVAIPADTDADKKGWTVAGSTGEYYRRFELPFDNSVAVLPSCTDDRIFTDCGLHIQYEEQDDSWTVWLTELPENACTLTLMFAFAINGGEL